MEWMLMPLRRYAEFTGRSRRKEYWMFALGITIVYSILFIFLLGGIDFSTGGMGGLGMVSTLLLVLLILIIFIPALAVQVRRFHDQDKSGWFVLLNLVPYVGGLIVLVMMCLDGTPGANRFGPDPKAGERLAPPETF
jgi:uncharacterized membrane protein YhaH (DUF805 family)